MDLFSYWISCSHSVVDKITEHKADRIRMFNDVQGGGGGGGVREGGGRYRI